MATKQQPATQPIFDLILAWGFVGIPLIWGVSETVVKAMRLFQ